MILKPIKKFHNIFKICLFIILFAILCYFRINSIYNQTVAYTYDQGRDFLKAAEIVESKRLTFIGPTTGIMGVFHGSWWYYVLTIFYLIFKGLPQGFYYGVLALHLISLILFSLFIYKKLSFLSSLLFTLIVSVSPYFIKISVFAANNTLTPIAVLLFLFSLYSFFQTEKPHYLFLLGLSLGFILETELSFGVFLIPAFLSTTIFFRPFRLILKKFRYIVFFISGFLIPLIPRILFEIKNNFLQTRALYQFLLHPTSTNPQTFYGAIIDRFRFFQNYFFGIFFDYSKVIAYIVLFSCIVIFFVFLRKFHLNERRISVFLLLIIVFIFLFSLVNRNNFFWENYLEGLQYIFLFILIIALSVLQKIKKFVYVLYLFILFFIFLNIFKFNLMINDKKSVPTIGLRADILTVKRLYEENQQPFCLRIYTPPVYPYTYDYLFHYYSSHGYFKPETGFINNQCWYIFDKETYQFRVDKWRKENIPDTAVIKKKILMENETILELWEEV